MKDPDYLIRENTRIMLTRQRRTNRELAAWLEMNPRYLTNKLSGAEGPMLRYWTSIAEFFGVDPRVLLADPERVERPYDERGISIWKSPGTVAEVVPA